MFPQGAFHAHSDWYFRRNEDGSVSILRPNPNKEVQDKIIEAAKLNTAGYAVPSGASEFFEAVRFDADSWASIVASVSFEGEGAATFATAKGLHGGFPF